MQWLNDWREMDETTRALLTLAALLAAASLIQLLLKRVLRVMSERGQIPPSMALRLRATVRLFLIVVVVSAGLQLTHVFDQAWAVLSAVLLAMAVGFVALWSVLSNVVCAILILIFRPFRMGDQIEILEPADVKNGFSGQVIDLSLMFTTIQAEENEENLVLLRIPNSVFFLKGVRVTVPIAHKNSTTFLDPMA